MHLTAGVLGAAPPLDKLHLFKRTGRAVELGPVASEPMSSATATDVATRRGALNMNLSPNFLHGLLLVERYDSSVPAAPSKLAGDGSGKTRGFVCGWAAWRPQVAAQ